MNIPRLLGPDFSYAQLVAAGLMCVRDIYNTARKSAANGGVGFPLEARNRGRADCKLADTIREDRGEISCPFRKIDAAAGPAERSVGNLPSARRWRERGLPLKDETLSEA